MSAGSPQPTGQVAPVTAAVLTDTALQTARLKIIVGGPSWARHSVAAPLRSSFTSRGQHPGRRSPDCIFDLINRLLCVLPDLPGGLVDPAFPLPVRIAGQGARGFFHTSLQLIRLSTGHLSCKL